MTTPSTDCQDAGFILVITLWFIALLAIISTALSLSARGAVKLAQTELGSAREMSLLDGAIELAVARLAFPGPGIDWQRDGRRYPIQIGEIKGFVRVIDEAARIDINKSDKKLIEGLLSQFVRDKNLVSQLTDHMVLNRGSTGVSEKPDGRAADRARNARIQSRSAQAPSRKFMDVSEIQFIPGMTRSLYRKIKPHLTVHSVDGRINPQAASVAVIRAALFATPGADERFIERRRTITDKKSLIESLPRRVQKYFTDEPGAVVTVRAQLAPGHGFSRQILAATIFPEADPKAPFRILRRQRIFAELQ